MKTKILILCAFLIQIWAFSQNNKMEGDIKKYTAKIDSIVTSEKINMNKEMDEVDKNFEKGKITSDQKMSQKKAIADKYEKIINDKVETESAELQKITTQTVVNSVFKKENDTTKTITQGILFPASKNAIIEFSHKKKNATPKDYLKSEELVVSYSFLNLTKEKGSLNPFETDSQMRIGNSHSFEIQQRYEKQVGGFESPVFIRYGLAYRSDTYMPKRPLVVAQNNDQIFLQNFANGDLKRSKLRNVYLTFPVEFQFVLNPKYTDFEGKRYLDGKAKQFRLGAGVYAGVNLRNIVKVKYHDTAGSFQKDKFTLDNGVNTFLFGAKVSVSCGSFNLFIKKDLTPIFNDKALFPSKNGIQIGLDITNLNF